MQPILIASVVAVLLIGTYLVLKKKGPAVTNRYTTTSADFDQFGPEDSGTWILTEKAPENSPTPCQGKFLGTYQVTVDAKGYLTGQPNPGNAPGFNQEIATYSDSFTYSYVLMYNRRRARYRIWDIKKKVIEARGLEREPKYLLQPLINYRILCTPPPPYPPGLPENEFTPEDSGTWIWTRESSDPCGDEVYSTHQITVDNQGYLTGILNPGTTPESNQKIRSYYVQGKGDVTRFGVYQDARTYTIEDKIMKLDNFPFVQRRFFQPLANYQKNCSKPLPPL